MLCCRGRINYAAFCSLIHLVNTRSEIKWPQACRYDGVPHWADSVKKQIWPDLTRMRGALGSFNYRFLALDFLKSRSALNVISLKLAPTRDEPESDRVFQYDRPPAELGLSSAPPGGSATREIRSHLWGGRQPRAPLAITIPSPGVGQSQARLR